MIKKTLLTTLIVLGCLLGAGEMRAQKVLIDGIYYTLSGSGDDAYATVVDNGTTAPGTYSGNVVIPNTVDNNEVTYKVTSIASQSFKNSTGLTSVTIPANVKSIGNKAFDGCTSLAEINLNATNLTSVGGSSNYSFNGCTHSCVVNIGEDVTSLPTYAFAGLTNISQINYNATNCSTSNSNIWNSSTSTSCVLTIGNNVTSIPAELFRGYSGLTSISMGNSIVTIGNNAFRNCNNNQLTEITLPESLTTIGDLAFYECNYASFNWLSTITSIGTQAFYNCKQLTTVIVNAPTISSSAFSGCTNLANLTIGASVTELGSTAFKGCTALTSITLNATLTTVPTSSSSYAFYQCTCASPCTLTIGPSVTNIPNSTFASLQNIGTIYFNATNCADFTSSSSNIMPSVISDGCALYVGDNVTKIPAYMLRYKKLTHVTIGSNVATIGDYALNLSSSPTIDIISKRATPPTAYANTFASGTKTIPVYVPTGTTAAYQAATGWSLFTNNYKEFTEYTSPATISSTETKDMIIFSAGGQLTIADGGKLTCNNIIDATTDNLIIADGGQLICNNSVNATLQKEITAAEVWGIPGADAWYFIASPVDGYATSNVIITGTSDTDLFSFDEGSSYWYNAQGSAHLFTTLTRGQGYLYANSTGDDLAFSGEMPATNSNIEKDLSFAGSGNAKGYNLMGNPFTCNLTTDNVKFYNGTTNTDITSYYTVENGTDLSLVTFSGNPIKPGRGFMIQATGEGQKLVFNPVAKSEKAAAKPSFITIEAGNDQFIDRACIQIGSGNTLRKMTINDHVSHVYVVYDGKDYAAATITEMQGEIPVYFVAAKNGQYTIKVKTDNLETSYLHLIDNLTGANIDLLQTPSYTFQGHITDISARFRLLFTTTGVDENADEGQTDFAFISDGQLIVNGTGILYVYDALGRQVSAKQVTPLTSTLSPLTSGVYVLQLVEGNSVRTQKIIVK